MTFDIVPEDTQPGVFIVQLLGVRYGPPLYGPVRHEEGVFGFPLLPRERSRCKLTFRSGVVPL